MKLLITGSAGFIGKYAVAAALARGWEVIERDSHHKEPSAKWDARSMTSLCGADCVLHLGAYSSNAGFAGDLTAHYDNNVRGLLNILGMAQKCGTRVVYASSSAVYGPPICRRHGASRCIECSTPSQWSDEAFRESDWISVQDTASHYAKSKLINEMMASSYEAAGLPCLGLRIFNAYGRGDELKPVGRQAPPTWMKAAKERGEPMVIFGDGAQAKDLIHVSDVVEIIMRLIESDATGIVNVGTGVATSFNDLARMVGRFSGMLESQIEYRPIKDPASYQFFTRADTTRLLSIIGPYKFKTVEEGIGDIP